MAITHVTDLTLDRRTLQRLRAEYLEMPGLRLRAVQVQRLCGIEAAICRTLLDTLVDEKFLRANTDGTYTRVTDGQTARTSADFQ
jgi:hypothetical protein